MVTSLTLEQPYDYPSASASNLKDIDNKAQHYAKCVYISWIILKQQQSPYLLKENHTAVNLTNSIKTKMAWCNLNL